MLDGVCTSGVSVSCCKLDETVAGVSADDATEGGRLLSVEPPVTAVAVVKGRSYKLDARDGAGESSANGVEGGDAAAA